MVVNDHRSVILAGVLATFALGVLATTAVPARASEFDSANIENAAPSPVAYVTIVRDGIDYTYYTKTRTVGDFLKERELAIGDRTSASVAADDAIVDGLKIVLHGSQDALAAHAASQRPRTVAWTTQRTDSISPNIKYRSDWRHAIGITTIVDAGRPGVRETTYRFVRQGNARAVRTTLASRIVRAPRVRIIARGVSTYSALARVAEAGFASAVRFAGSAFHMIATAYTAGCYGCSGITASGLRAGLGVIAVDPRIIPLGTKLFIPGYGRAVAGDTGGMILGNRVDLGMATQDDAIRYGRRPVTVYVLR